MRLSGLQNPQAARAGSPGKHSATGEHSRVAADALPGLQNCPAYTFTAAIGTLSRRRRNAPVRATKPAGGAAGSPGKHSATGEHSRVAADALPGLHAHNHHRAGSPDKAPLAPPPGCSALCSFRATGGEIGLPGRRQRVYAKSAVEWRPVA
ncbi:hypothetical protein [Klebsiella michiganensis]|nr:hypothetical protein [Klebsiella michiganensis]MBQ4653949.1 hypothetical protein [Klebsiella michiganensis]MBQ4660460.1 hypothetical protein [Klebsiella michiganensis]MDV1379658.1 hypothetical protein [Klebsiella michiganensis]MDV1429935.1 hypothetical protein [Klebsiella michiganensis]MDV1950303.1 hypothetical protein [Klebsiella michiganensis]